MQATLKYNTSFTQYMKY